MTGLISRFRRDHRGVSAVEFALLAPVLITFYFGLAEITQAMMAERRANHAIAAVGDLVTQTNSIDDDELDDIYEIADAILKPYPSTGFKLRVTHVSQNASGAKTIDWSSPHGLAALTSVPTMPAGLIGNSQSVVIAEMAYTFDSPVDYMIPNALTFRKTYYYRPRKADKVTKLN